MPTIDESVVKLSLDDGQFDKASDRTIKKLDELKNSLNFHGAVDGFKEIEKAAKQTDFSPMEKGIQAVSTQFDALYTIADATIRRLVNGGIDKIESTLKSLTIDNVTAGWDKYAQKTSAVQTIMASTADQFENVGTQMDYVEGQLDKLNWFTDETSYKFLDMANNIGKFTANEVGLDDAVTAMQGISNWAAISGSGIHGASMAMYNLAQAISMGSLKLQDWRSIELANMGTSEFKRVAMEAGEAAGTLIKVADGVYRTIEKGTEVTTQSFRNSLSETWLTTDVLMATLNKYGSFTNELYKFAEATDLSATPLIRYINEYKEGTFNLEDAMISTGMAADELIDWLERLGSEEYDLGRRAFAAAQEAKTFQEAVDAVKEAVGTGWSNTFEHIFGNYEEAKKLWSDLAEGLYEVFVESGNMRNGLLRDWKALGGRTYLIEGLYTIFGRLRDAIFFFKDTVEEIFPPKTAEELVSMTEGFRDFVELLTPSENTINSIHSALILLLTVIQKLGQIAVVIFAGLEPIWSLLSEIGAAIVGLIGDISALLGLNLEKIFSADHLTALYQIIYAISSLIAALARGALVQVVSIMGNVIKFGEDIYRTFKNGEGGIKGFVNAILINFGNLFNTLSGGNGISGLIGNIITNVQNLFESIQSGDSIFNKFFNSVYAIAAAVLGPIALLIKSVIFGDDEFESSPIVEFFKNIGSAINESNLVENIGIASKAILQFVSDAIGGVEGLNNAGRNLHEVISWIIDQFGVLWDWFVEELTSLSFRDIADVMVILFIAQLIDAFTKLTLAAKGAVTGVSGILTSIKNVIDTFSGNGLTNMANSINTFLANTKYLQMALAIGVLTDGLIRLSEIDTGKLGIAVATIATVSGILAGFMALMKKFSKDTTQNGGNGDNNTTINIAGLNSVLQFAIGIRLLAGAVSAIADIIDSEAMGPARYEGIIVGLIGLAAVMAEVGAFAYVVNKLDLKEDLKKAAATLALFAAGLTAMIVPVTLFSLFNWEDWAQGILGAASLMISFAAAAKLMGSVDVKSILAAGGALNLIAVGLTAISIPVLALSLLDLAGLAQGVISVTVMLAALTAACVAISKWGSSNAVGMVAAGAAMISFSAAVLVLTAAMKVVEGISWEGIAAGIAVIVVAFLGFAGLAAICQTASLGLLALAAVIVSVGASFALFAVGVKTLVDAVAEFVVICGVIMAAGEVLGDDFPSLVEKGMENVELVIRSFLSIIPNLAGELTRVATVFISSFALGIIAAAPDILNGLLVILTLVLEVIAKSAGPIARALGDLLDGLSKEMPYLMDAAARFIEEFFAGLGVLVFDALVGLIRGLFAMIGLSKFGDQIADMMHSAGDNMVLGLEKGMEDNKDGAYNAGADVMNAALQGMKDAADINSPSGVTEAFAGFLGEGFFNGINSLLPDFENSGFATMGKYFTGMTTGIQEGGKQTESMLNSLLKMVGIKVDAINEAVGFSYEIGNPDLAGLKPQERLAMAKEAAKAGNKTGSVMGESFNKALNTSFNDAVSSSSGSGSKSGGSGKSGGGSSASAKVKTEAEKIIESYKDALAELEYLDKKHKGEYNLLEILNIDVTEMQKKTAKMEYINKEIETQTKRTQIAQEKYEKIAKAMGKTSQEARDAEIEWIDQQVSLAQLQNEVVELQNDIIADAAKQLELNQKNAELTYNLWVTSNQKASQVEQQEKKLEYTMQKLEYTSSKVTEATKAYNEALEKYGEDASETKELLNELLEVQNDYADISNEVNEIQEAIVELGKEQAELAAENASLEYAIWLQTHKNASQAEKEARTTEEYMRRYESSMMDLVKATENWKKACERYGEESLEAAQAYNAMLVAQSAMNESLDQLRNQEKEHLEWLTEELSITAQQMELEDKLWESANEGASKQEKQARKMQTLVRNQVVAEQELILLQKEYNRLLKEQGEDAQDTRNAYNKILEKQIEINGYLKESKDLAQEALNIEMSELEFEEKRLKIADEMWQTANSHASASAKSAHEVEQINAKMVLSMKQLNNLAEQYNKQIERYGQNSDEARAAWESYANKQKEILELQNRRKEVEMEIIENELEMMSIMESRSKSEQELWQALNQDAADSEDRSRKMTYQMQNLEYATEKLRNASKKYNYALKMYGEEAKETQQLFNDMLDAQVAYANTYNELKSVQQEIITKNNEILEQLSYSEQLLDYGYNMWEKLNGDISDAQKIEAQIKKLNQDITLQVQRANYYGAEWKKAVAKYGQNSSEAQEAYLNYLEALYKALDLQASLEEKETSLTDLRADNAQKLQDAWDEIKAKDLVGGTSIYDELVAMGLSEKEIEDYVKEKAGIIEDTIGTEMDFSIENMQKKAEDALREWGLTWVDGTYEVADTVVSTAGNCMGEMTDIIAEGAAEGQAAAEEAMAEIESILEDGAEEAVEITEDGMEDIVSAIEGSSDDVVSAMDGVIDEALWWASNSRYDDLIETGHQLVYGIGQGISINKWSVIDRIIEVVEEAIWWANYTAQIHSPSRRTMWSGEMLDAGYVQGIENRAGEVARAMAAVVQNGIDAMAKVAHTSNTLDFAAGLISDGIVGGIEGYSYNIISVGKAVLKDLSDEYDSMVDDLIGENQWLIDALRDYGFDETTHGIEFVVNLDATDAKTELESLFEKREADLDYYDDLLDMQERNAKKDQKDLAVQAERNAIQRELNRVMKSIESYEKAIENIVSAGRAASYEDSIAGKKTEFVQNIYSTKPLSPLDIYRNTNSLLLKFTAWR